MALTMAIIIILPLLLTGCSSKEVPTTSLPTQDTPIETTPVQVIDVLSDSAKEIEARLVDTNWTSPAEVRIGNYYPGANAEWSIKIHNGGDIYSKFRVAYSAPSRTSEGYSMPPEEAQYWIIVADSTPMLAPKETKEILVTLAIPKDTV